MNKQLLILVIVFFSYFTASCTDYNQLFLEHGEGDIPFWIHEVSILNDSDIEYLVAYTSQEEIDMKEEKPDYVLSTYLISLFSSSNGKMKTWDFINYGMTVKSLEEKVFYNEKLQLGDFHNFFFLNDLNKNGIQEIIFPIHAGGGQYIIQILEYDSETQDFKLLLNQIMDHFYDYALQTIEYNQRKSLKIFPYFGNRTREKIDEGVYKQKYLIFEWNELEGIYTVAETGFEQTYEDDLHW